MYVYILTNVFPTYFPGPAFQAKRFYFSIDGNVVSSVKSFKEALTLLFCSYFVMNIKYAPHVGNTLDFFQRYVHFVKLCSRNHNKPSVLLLLLKRNKLLLFYRIVAKIEPERGTKMTKKNYKQPLSERLQTLLDRYANWQKGQEQEQGEDDNADDFSNSGYVAV